jgi:hypothetical protein
MSDGGLGNRPPSQIRFRRKLPVTNISKYLIAFVAALALATSVQAQTSLTQTTLSAAISSSARTIPVASVTGISAGSVALIDSEIVAVASTGTNSFAVAPRGAAGTFGAPHVSGAMVLVGPAPAFIAYDPSGACTNGQGLFLYSPVVNTRTGNEWLCSSVTGKVIPGFGNTAAQSAPATAVASAAGKVTPSGPLFHITGALAITGFNIPVGFDPTEGQTVCAIPDGAFTTTNANNIAIASTGVVSKLLCWAYDPNAAKFYPTY